VLLRILAALMVMLLLAVDPAEARPVPPLEALETLRNAFAGMTDFSAEIIQEKQLSLMKRKLVSTGYVRFKKPGLFFMEIDPPHASRLLLNDTTLTLNLLREKSTSRAVLPPEQGLQRWFAIFAKPLKRLPEGMEVRADQQGELLTVTIAPAGGGQVREIAVTLLPDGTFRRLSIVEQRGDRTVITFSRMLKNKGLVDKDFRVE
jgi:outer membrane lipoprotein carrier protein